MLRVSQRRLAEGTVGNMGPAYGGKTATDVIGVNVDNNYTRRFRWFRPYIYMRRYTSFRHKSGWGRPEDWAGAGEPNNTLTLYHCVDNTNCRHFRAIRQMREKGHAGYPCTVVVDRVSVHRFKTAAELAAREQLEPGHISFAVLFTRRQWHRRYSGLMTQFDKQAGILVGPDRVPTGTRVMYAAGRHVHHRFHLKALVLANFIV